MEIGFMFYISFLGRVSSFLREEYESEKIIDGLVRFGGVGSIIEQQLRFPDARCFEKPICVAKGQEMRLRLTFEWMTTWWLCTHTSWHRRRLTVRTRWDVWRWLATVI